MTYTAESARRIARAGYRNLTEYARATGHNRDALSEGFALNHVKQFDIIVGERVRMTFEYAAQRGVSLRKAALATGWTNAATMRRCWKRLLTGRLLLGNEIRRSA